MVFWTVRYFLIKKCSALDQARGLPSPLVIHKCMFLDLYESVFMCISGSLYYCNHYINISLKHLKTERSMFIHLPLLGRLQF